MGEKYQKNEAAAGGQNTTPVNGLAIAALITRAMTPAQRERVLARINSQSPVTGAALEASITKVEAQIAARTTAVAKQISKQISLPERTTPAEQAPIIRQTKVQPPIESDSGEDLSPAEILLQSREGSHEELERELERQKPAPGRRRIISA